MADKISPFVRIVPPDSASGPSLGFGTLVLDQEGNSIDGVTGIDVRITADEVITATITVMPIFNKPFDAIAIISEESLPEWAEFYGYDLVKKTDPDN